MEYRYIRSTVTARLVFTAARMKSFPLQFSRYCTQVYLQIWGYAGAYRYTLGSAPVISVAVTEAQLVKVKFC